MESCQNCSRLEVALAAAEEHERELYEENLALLKEQKRYLDALEDAPHENGCDSLVFYGADEFTHGCCNCWKAAANSLDNPRPI